ncbi:unnamed protein product, partial [Urochloa humidicola]
RLPPPAPRAPTPSPRHGTAAGKLRPLRSPPPAPWTALRPVQPPCDGLPPLVKTDGWARAPLSGDSGGANPAKGWLQAARRESSCVAAVAQPGERASASRCPRAPRHGVVGPLAPARDERAPTGCLTPTPRRRGPLRCGDTALPFAMPDAAGTSTPHLHRCCRHHPFALPADAPVSGPQPFEICRRGYVAPPLDATRGAVLLLVAWSRQGHFSLPALARSRPRGSRLRCASGGHERSCRWRVGADRDDGRRRCALVCLHATLASLLTGDPPWMPSSPPEQQTTVEDAAGTSPLVSSDAWPLRFHSSHVCTLE